MKIIISEKQYRLIAEQTKVANSPFPEYKPTDHGETIFPSNGIDWLIDWFKKVPEEKLVKTFTMKNENGSEKTMTKNEILNLLSDKSKIVVVNDPEEIKRLNGRLGFFQNSWDKNSNPKDKQYVGKLVINGDWKNIIKTNPMYRDVKGNIDIVKHHEQTHLLQHTQDVKGDWAANASKIISGFCKGNPTSVCDDPFGYYSRPTEIYGHLFTMRELIGIQPADEVVDANAVINNKIVTINVSVNRNGKRINLPTKTMDIESSTFKTLYCCNKSFKQTLTYLHNTLAKGNNPNQSELDKIA